MIFRFSAPFTFILLCIYFQNAPSLHAQSSESPVGASTSIPAIIRSVDVRPQANGLAIEITASAPFVPHSLRLTGPDRLVFDFTGYQLQGANRRISVDNGPVQQVRLSQFTVHPPVARVVVDSKEPLEFQVERAGNNVVIKIPFVSATAASAALPPPSVAQSKNHATASPAAPDVKISSQPSPMMTVQTSMSRTSAYSLQTKAKALSVKDLQTLEDKAKAGDPEAETTLALAYHDAVLLKKDDIEALRLLHKAADRGFMTAEESLGLFAQAGIGMAQPAPDEAMAWFQKAAEQGSLGAETNIGLMYADGVGVAKDPATAMSWFRKAADGGEGAAQYNLALMYFRGEGTPQNYPEYIHWLTAAADQNVVPAVMDLAAYCLRPPDGTPADVARAIHYYEKADELGNDRAPAILGNIYATGAQGRPDYEQAVKWYRKAADKGQREGQYGLGIRYAYGQGVPVDLLEARRLFTAAAAQGMAQAQYNLASMCEEGSGAPADRTCAAHYYELAADQGLPKAQFRLGRLLAANKEPENDRVSAYKWLMLAQASVKDSSPVLNNLRKSMSEQEISEADHEVDNWRIAHPQNQ